MPVDILADEVQSALKSASDYLRAKRPDEGRRRQHLKYLENMESRLEADIQERQTTFPEELQAKEDAEIAAKLADLHENTRFKEENGELRARQQKFDELRQINGGAFPRNISPVLYSIPLILIGVAEWYVNYSTFAAIFIPVLAIAGTLLVAAIFAGASHLHGAYLKQLAEILHPSVENRSELGRKIVVVMATMLLFMAFGTVVWLRYTAIADQLGVNSTSSSGAFGGPDSGLIWSRLGPTIVLNLLIWGIGTLYAWAINEKVPNLRESYRELRRTQGKVKALRAPFEAEQRRIRALYERERQRNDVALKEYKNLLEEVKGTAKRLNS
jgi:hypothetical protein